MLTELVLLRPLERKVLKDSIPFGHPVALSRNHGTNVSINYKVRAQVAIHI